MTDSGGGLEARSGFAPGGKLLERLTNAIIRLQKSSSSASFLDEALHTAAGTLGLSHALFLEHEESDLLRVRAAVGWADETHEGTTFSSEAFSSIFNWSRQGRAIANLVGDSSPLPGRLLASANLKWGFAALVPGRFRPRGFIIVLGRVPVHVQPEQEQVVCATANLLSIHLAGAEQGAPPVERPWLAALDALPFLVFVLGPDGRIDRGNRAIERAGFCDVRSLTGLQVHDVLHPGCRADRCPVQQFLESALNEPERMHLEMVYDENLHLHWRFRITPGQPGTELEQTGQRIFVAEQITPSPLPNGEEVLTGGLLQAQESERQRIAAELHDNIGQRLTSIKFVLDQVAALYDGAGKEGTKGVDTLRRMIRETIDELRRISLNLRPSMLDDLGLVATLRWFLGDITTSLPDVTVEFNLAVGEEAIPKQLRVPAFRIVQEALHNVVKHSRAERVSVDLTGGPDGLRLAIRDNGCGFRSANESSAGGLGLRSMEHRAQLSGGELKIDSFPGRGTSIEVDWETSAPPLRLSSRPATSSPDRC